MRGLLSLPALKDRASRGETVIWRLDQNGLVSEILFFSGLGIGNLNAMDSDVGCPCNHTEHNPNSKNNDIAHISRSLYSEK